MSSSGDTTWLIPVIVPPVVVFFVLLPRVFLLQKDVREAKGSPGTNASGPIYYPTPICCKLAWATNGDPSKCFERIQFTESSSP